MIDPPERYDPVLTVIQSFVLNGSTQFVFNETIEDNVVSRFLKEVMGIYYEPKWAAQGDAVQQKWAVTLASGDFPEYMNTYGYREFGQMLEANLVEDITPIWDAVASPLTKRLKEYPDGRIWKGVKQGDKIYGFVWTNGGIAENDMGTWVRKDWLDKVGLGIPTTLDEYAAVAKAFVDAGLATDGVGATAELVTWMGGFVPVFGAYGVMPGRWLKDDKGGLINSSILPGVKDALALIAKWYADGLIDPEFITVDAGKLAEPIASGRVGLFFGPPWCWGWPLAGAMQNNPESEWVWTDVPAGPDGRRGRDGTNVYGEPAWFLKGTDPKKIEAVINHLNWKLQLAESSRLGYSFQFEGYDYTLVEDEETGLEVAGPGVQGATPEMYEGGAGYPVFCYPKLVFDTNKRTEWITTFDGDLGTLNPLERTAVLKFRRDPKSRYAVEGYNRLVETLDYQIITEFFGLPTKSMTEKGAILGKLEAEMHLAVVTGQQPISAFDDFVDEWKKQGGDQVTQEVNEWWGRQS